MENKYITARTVADSAMCPACVKDSEGVSIWAPIKLCWHQAEKLAELLERSTDESDTLYGVLSEDYLAVVEYIVASYTIMQLMLIPEAIKPEDARMFSEKYQHALQDRQPCRTHKPEDNHGD